MTTKDKINSLHTGVSKVISLPVKVLVNSFQPPDIVVRICTVTQKPGCVEGVRDKESVGCGG